METENARPGDEKEHLGKERTQHNTRQTVNTAKENRKRMRDWQRREEGNERGNKLENESREENERGTNGRELMN